jgi:hypothetical protein
MSSSGEVPGANVPHDYVPGKGYVPRTPSEELQAELEPLPVVEDEKEGE